MCWLWNINWRGDDAEGPTIPMEMERTTERTAVCPDGGSHGRRGVRIVDFLAETVENIRDPFAGTTNHLLCTIVPKIQRS